MTICMIYDPHQIGYYYSGDEINKNETGRACSIYGQKMGVYRDRENADDVGIHRRTILKWIFKK